MKHRETLDEAIDRVAMSMTQSGDADRVEIQPVWLAASTRPGFGWRLAGIAGVSMVAIALLVMLRSPRVEEHRSALPVGAAALEAWSPLAPAVGARNPTSASERSGRPLGRPIRAALKGGPYTVSMDAPSEAGVRPTWGIPFIEAPAAIAVSAPSVGELEVDAVAVEPLDIAPLTVTAIDAGVQDSKDFDSAQTKEQ